MRIGHDENFLSLDLSSSDGGYSAFRAEAVATASGRVFTASHDPLLMSAAGVTLQRFADFESLKSEQMEIRISEGGWLRFQRDARGSIMVKFRICSWKASAAMEGAVMVEGEFVGGFCREFGALLRGHH